MNELVSSYFAIIFSGASLLILVGEKLFGGATALHEKFRKLEKETATAIAAVRQELDTKIGEYERVSTVGFDAIRSNIHAMQIGLLEFRAQMAEGLHLYIRKDDYNSGISDVKRDMGRGFAHVDERLGQLQDLLVHGADPSKFGSKPR